ncbi:unnamed protein product, partial [Callosobruchus maculatus]
MCSIGLLVTAALIGLSSAANWTAPTYHQVGQRPRGWSRLESPLRRGRGWRRWSGIRPRSETR